MQIEELQKQLEMGDIAFHGNCNDCDTPVKVICKVNGNSEIIISGGAIYNPKIGATEQRFFKCDACFKRDKTLKSWNPCEVYSRVVGYLRPVQQYNLGKLEEYKQRKEFVVE